MCWAWQRPWPQVWCQGPSVCATGSGPRSAAWRPGDTECTSRRPPRRRGARLCVGWEKAGALEAGRASSGPCPELLWMCSQWGGSGAAFSRGIHPGTPAFLQTCLQGLWLAGWGPREQERPPGLPAPSALAVAAAAVPGPVAASPSPPCPLAPSSGREGEGAAGGRQTRAGHRGSGEWRGGGWPIPAVPEALFSGTGSPSPPFSSFLFSLSTSLLLSSSHFPTSVPTSLLPLRGPPLALSGPDRCLLPPQDLANLAPRKPDW